MLLRASVLVGNRLGLGSNTTLLSVTMSALLTAVQEIGIVLSNLRRILRRDLVDGLLEVALLCKLRLLSRAQRSSLGVGRITALVGSSKTLSISRNAVLGRLGLAGRASLARLEVIGVCGGDGSRILLHLAEDILRGAFKVLQTTFDQRIVVV